MLSLLNVGWYLPSVTQAPVHVEPSAVTNECNDVNVWKHHCRNSLRLNVAMVYDQQLTLLQVGENHQSFTILFCTRVKNGHEINTVVYSKSGIFVW